MAQLSTPTRVVLAGTSTPLVRVLERLGNRDLSGITFAAVYTDGQAGDEGFELARTLGIATQPLALLGGEDAARQLAAHSPDWLFNINTTLIYPGELLRVVSRGALNLHPGRLPEYAGLHTHQWAIRNGEERFGATLHWMVPEIDAGPLALQELFPLTAKDTGLSLFVKCLNSGASLVMQDLEMIGAGQKLPRIDQDLTRRHLYLHADALDGRIRWTDSARRIADFVRAADYAPFTCPTYVPEATLGGRNIAVRKAVQAEQQEAAGDAWQPGDIIDITDEGMLVATGQGRVLIRAASLDDGKTLKGEKLAQAMSWARTGRFDTVDAIHGAGESGGARENE